ncbi:DNA gyrase inhibitor YacG [Zhongshania guokunii]|uniref:DNA gyrase inhibitor YacG n=1 Tax=Zhongshania guokunii TaxID=641783 RepID=A0ABV3U429_9GAMM
MNQDQNKAAALTVPCPQCKTELVWDTSNIFRPFCSESCKNHDLIAWANEEHNIPGDSLHDDVLSRDLEQDF